MRQKGEAILDCSIYQKKKVTPKGSKIGTFRYLQCLFSMYGSKSFNDVTWKSYLYIWIELNFTHYSRVFSLLLLMINILYSWFNLMDSESFDLVRGRYAFWRRRVLFQIFSHFGTVENFLYITLPHTLSHTLYSSIEDITKTLKAAP